MAQCKGASQPSPHHTYTYTCICVHAHTDSWWVESADANAQIQTLPVFHREKVGILISG